jgi:hypothetical protein
MRKTYFVHALRLAGLAAFASLIACSSGGPLCGNCTVPGFNPAPSATAIGAVVLPPVVVASPAVVPTPPVPTPPPQVLSCNQGAGSIALGPALAPFALLAGSTVTNTGNTIVTYAAQAVTAPNAYFSSGTNDNLIGVSPGTAVTGFYPPGTDTGGTNAIYAAGYNTNATIPAAAQNELIAAYNSAAGMAATATFLGGQDLSQASVPGHPTGTLPPGVYASPSTLSIMAGNLTLDGGGNPQSVFVFQVGSGLTTTFNGSNSGNVILTNGASACNIFWQIGSSAALGGQSFYGNVLALSSITLTSSTAFSGRALARNGAVTISTASLVTNPGGQ